VAEGFGSSVLVQEGSDGAGKKRGIALETSPCRVEIEYSPRLLGISDIVSLRILEAF
jgi:hypothetical protein